MFNRENFVCVCWLIIVLSTAYVVAEDTYRHDIGVYTCE